MARRGCGTWRPATIRQFDGHTGGARCSCADGNYVLTGSEDMTAQRKDAATGAEVASSSGASAVWTVATFRRATRPC
jgi:hypothetical protein